MGCGTPREINRTRDLVQDNTPATTDTKRVLKAKCVSQLKFMGLVADVQGAHRLVPVRRARLSITGAQSFRHHRHLHEHRALAIATRCDASNLIVPAPEGDTLVSGPRVLESERLCFGSPCACPGARSCAAFAGRSRRGGCTASPCNVTLWRLCIFFLTAFCRIS